MSCNAKKDPMVLGEYSTVGRTGQEQKRNHRKEGSKQRRKRKNGMRTFFCNNLLIRQ